MPRRFLIKIHVIMAKMYVKMTKMVTNRCHFIKTTLLKLPIPIIFAIFAKEILITTEIKN